MAIIGRLRKGLEEIASEFTIEPLAAEFGPRVAEALHEHGKDRQRKSVMTPVLTVWYVIAMALRRELNYHALLDWLLSGFRQNGWDVPRHSVADGTISHARTRLGLGVFRTLFRNAGEIACPLEPDFHGRVSMALDGSTGTMPDTPENRERFGKPGTGRGKAAFPQVRLMAIVQALVHGVFAVAYAPYRGKGTGEQTLGLQLILDHACRGMLFLLDRGLSCMPLLHALNTKGADFIARIRDNIKLVRIREGRYADGSYLAWIRGQIVRDGRKEEIAYQVRVIEYTIPGFRKVRLITSLLDAEIDAREIAQHYHVRWEVELSYDSIKTHQCGTRTGQCHTLLRSKTPLLAEQEIYALLTAYNLVRYLINQACVRNNVDPRSIGFVDAMRTIIDAIPSMRVAPTHRLPWLYGQLLEDIARCAMDRWRRPRKYPRVVRVKMSKFKLKRSHHRELHWDPAAEMTIVGAGA